MNEKENAEWEKAWEKLVLHDAVIGIVATPEVGDKFEPEKYNYANQKLNELNSFIYVKGKELISKSLSDQRKEIVRELTIDVDKMEWVDNTKKWDMGVEPCIECQNADRIKKVLSIIKGK